MDNLVFNSGELPPSVFAGLAQSFELGKIALREAVAYRMRRESEFFEQHCRENALPKIKGDITAGKLKWRGVYVVVKPKGHLTTKWLEQRGVQISPVLEIGEFAAHDELKVLTQKANS